MDFKELRAEYVAPEIDVMELEGQGVLCSSGSTQDYTSGDWSW